LSRYANLADCLDLAVLPRALEPDTFDGYQLIRNVLELEIPVLAIYADHSRLANPEYSKRTTRISNTRKFLAPAIS
jgi:hypothetical protein